MAVSRGVLHRPDLGKLSFRAYVLVMLKTTVQILDMRLSRSSSRDSHCGRSLKNRKQVRVLKWRCE